MGWLADVFRKGERGCARCRMGPTHLYGPRGALPGDLTETGADAPRGAGLPLCNSCLAERLEQDLSRFTGRALLFEPSLGPEALVFCRLDGEETAPWSAPRRSAALGALGRMGTSCGECGNAPRFLWIPSDPGANLFGEEWLDALAAGALSPEAAFCGRCASRRLVGSIEQRGLFFEAVVPPEEGDGAILAASLPL